MSRTVARDLTIAADIEADLHVRGHASELQQALLNLCINARDAMPSGGALTLRARRRRLAGRDEVAREEGVPPGDYVELRVEDTGSGMDAATLKHAFEPFFTTKQAGKGSGLGLAIVHAVAHDHGGHVGIRSALGAGTRVTLFLPASEAPAAPRRPSPTREVVLAPEPDGVLVLEHDAAVRRSAQRMLEHLGRRALVAENGPDALALLREHAREVGLVLLDLTLPRPGGARLLADMRALNPSLRVVVSSASAGPHVEEVLRAGVQGTLSKPYTLQQLVEALRSR